MQLGEVIVPWAIIMIMLENCLERKKIMFHVMVLKDRFLYLILKSTCATGKVLMTRLENGLETRRYYIALFIWENVVVFQEELNLNKGLISEKNTVTLCELYGCLE